MDRQRLYSTTLSSMSDSVFTVITMVDTLSPSFSNCLYNGCYRRCVELFSGHCSTFVAKYLHGSDTGGTL